MRTVAVDFETEKIEDRPKFPPKPVGVAIYGDKERRRYLAWGHPEQNNCTRNDARKQLLKLYKDPDVRVVFHNCAFDIDVGCTHMNLPWPKRYEDTEFLSYLFDPREESLGLKPLADKYLNMPPDEQTELRDWVEANIQIEKGQKWGAYIALAPGKLVGKYAIGDVVRTYKLFKYFRKLVIDELGMTEPYERELRVVPVRLHMETKGVKLRATKLKREIGKFRQADENLQKRIKRRLGITKAKELSYPKGYFNFNSGAQLARALEEAGKVDEFIYTAPSKSFPDGQPSTKIENLQKVCTDKPLLLDLGMRSVLGTYLNTFMEKWLEQGDENGFLHPTFNQIRSTDEHGGRGTKGTKTGRPSSSNPNFNAVPADVEESKNRDTLIALAKYLRKYGLDFVGLRDYIAPDDGCVFINRDYNQQELRILAHYEDGALCEEYNRNPYLDVHQFVRDLIHDILSLDFPRKSVKITNFSTIYGAGGAKIADQIGCPTAEAYQIRSSVKKVLPGVKDLDDELKRYAKNGWPIWTFGGRQYYCEDSEYVDGELRNYAYKMLNLLIQGGAADITKEAMILVYEAIGDVRTQVYDEIMSCVPRATWKRDMKLMREAMESIKLDVPLPSDGGWSSVSWGRLKEAA